MKNRGLKKEFILVLLAISGFIFASENGNNNIYFQLEGQKIALDKTNVMNQAFLQSPVIKALQGFGGIKGNGAIGNPFILEGIPYDNFHFFIQWIDGYVTLDNFGFDGWASFAQLIDYFGLIGQTDFDQLIFDLGERLEANQENIALLDEETQGVCNRVIAYYQEHGIKRLSFEKRPQYFVPESLINNDNLQLERKLGIKIGNYFGLKEIKGKGGRNFGLENSVMVTHYGLNVIGVDPKLIQLEQNLIEKGVLQENQYLYRYVYDLLFFPNFAMIFQPLEPENRYWKLIGFLDIEKEEVMSVENEEIESLFYRYKEKGLEMDPDYHEEFIFDSLIDVQNFILPPVMWILKNKY